MKELKGRTIVITSVLIALMIVMNIFAPFTADAQNNNMMLSAADARKMVIDRFASGIVQKIEYNYDDTNPQYKGEALKKGYKVVFEINANNSTWAKWDVSNDNSWDSFANELPNLITMDQAANLVILESKNKDTFIQKIDFLWDDSEPLYQGEAFIKDIKYSFEIKAKNGSFQKWDINRGDETWAEKYYNVRSKSVDGDKVVIELQINNKDIKINGITKELDPGRGTVPQIVNNRTMLPIRAIIEALGGKVEYEPVDRKITIKLDDETIDMWIGNTSIKVNNNDKTLDVAPFITYDRTMVPVRFIVENLGYEVEWKEETKTVIIK